MGVESERNLCRIYDALQRASLWFRDPRATGLEPLMPPSTTDLLMALLALLAIFIPLLLAGALVLLPDLLKKRRKLARRPGRVTLS